MIVLIKVQRELSPSYIMTDFADLFRIYLSLSFLGTVLKCWLIYVQMYAVMHTVYKIAEIEYCNMTNGSWLTCVQICIQ